MNKDSVEKILTEICIHSPKNRLYDVKEADSQRKDMEPGRQETKTNQLEKAWDTPIVGFASAADPIFEDIKKNIGSHHWTPIEAWKQAFPENDTPPANLTIISVVCPQTKASKSAHKKETAVPAENWVRSRLYWEPFAADVAQSFTSALSKEKIEALCPVLLPQWRFVGETSSTWSERHAAYACGLGTFGLSDGLITAVGKAMRCMSFIAKYSWEPTKRPYRTHKDYCLFYQNGSCKKCIDRCPAKAIDEKGHDKDRCCQYEESLFDEVMERYGLPNKSCGFCQTGVPCESKIPGR